MVFDECSRVQQASFERRSCLPVSRDAVLSTHVDVEAEEGHSSREMQTQRDRERTGAASRMGFVRYTHHTVHAAAGSIALL